MYCSVWWWTTPSVGFRISRTSIYIVLSGGGLHQVWASESPELLYIYCSEWWWTAPSVSFRISRASICIVVSGGGLHQVWASESSELLCIL